MLRLGCLLAVEVLLYIRPWPELRNSVDKFFLQAANFCDFFLQLMVEQFNVFYYLRIYFNDVEVVYRFFILFSRLCFCIVF